MSTASTRSYSACKVPKVLYDSTIALLVEGPPILVTVHKYSMLQNLKYCNLRYSSSSSSPHTVCKYMRDDHMQQILGTFGFFDRPIHVQFPPYCSTCVSISEAESFAHSMRSLPSPSPYAGPVTGRIKN